MFEAETVYTLEECRKAAWAVWLHSKKIMAFFICLVFMLVVGILSISFGSYDTGSKILLLTGIYILMLFVLIERQIRNGFKTNRIIRNSKVQFDFYDEYFDVISESGNSHIEYDQLYRLMETKENFYPMISCNNMFIVRKADCSRELIDFLHKIA